MRALLLSLLLAGSAFGATIVAAAGGGNWTAGGSWVGGVAPTAADNAQLDATSGAITINSGSLCRSLDATGYTSTITSSATLTIGDATAGTGNKALTFPASGATWAGVQATFVSTSATVQDVDFGGATTSLIFWNGTGGSWRLTRAVTGLANNIWTHQKGTLDTNGVAVSISGYTLSGTLAKTLSLGASVITLSNSGANGTWAFADCTNLTFSAGTSVINLKPHDRTFRSCDTAGGPLTYYDVTFILGNAGAYGQGGPVSIASGTSFHNISWPGDSNKGNILQFTNSITVTGTLTVNGNSATNRVLVGASPTGTAITITSAANTFSNVDFRDITGAGAGSWSLAAITGNSGDCGGNSGITFTTAATQHWLTATSSSWSTSGNWTSRVPLCQDPVVMDKAFNASVTVTADMPRLGKSIDWSGATVNTALTWARSRVADGTQVPGATIYGSVTLKTGMTMSGTTTSQMESSDRTGTLTYDTAGVALTNPLLIAVPGATVQLINNVLVSSSTLTHLSGTFNANNLGVTVTQFTSNSGITRTLTMGTGTWTLTGTGAIWTVDATGLGVSANLGAIKVTDTSSTASTFAGGVSIAYGTLWWARGSSTASNTISGSNTFATFKDDGSAAHSILFTAATTTTVIIWTVSGSSGNAITLNGTTTGTYTLTYSGAGVVSSDWLNIQHCLATPSTLTWYAGANSVNNQATATAGSGWIFTVPPGGATSAVRRRKFSQ